MTRSTVKDKKPKTISKEEFFIHGQWRLWMSIIPTNRFSIRQFQRIDLFSSLYAVFHRFLPLYSRLKSQDLSVFSRVECYEARRYIIRSCIKQSEKMKISDLFTKYMPFSRTYIYIIDIENLSIVTLKYCTR